MLSTKRERLVALASRYAIPAIYQNALLPATGGLSSYGPDLIDTWRLVGVYAAKILKGAKPADRPVAKRCRLRGAVGDGPDGPIGRPSIPADRYAVTVDAATTRILPARLPSSNRCLPVLVLTRSRPSTCDAEARSRPW